MRSHTAPSLRSVSENNSSRITVKSVSENNSPRITAESVSENNSKRITVKSVSGNNSPRITVKSVSGNNSQRITVKSVSGNNSPRITVKEGLEQVKNYSEICLPSSKRTWNQKLGYPSSWKGHETRDWDTPTPGSDMGPETGSPPP